MKLEELQKNTVKVEHKYSKRTGKWGYWLVYDWWVLEFLGEENRIINRDIDEIINNFEHYGKKIPNRRNITT